MSIFLESIDKSIENIKNVVALKDQQIAYLLEENEKLKKEHYKDETIKELKKQNERLIKENLQGFPISDEERKKIDEWYNDHLHKKHWDKINDRPVSFGAAGGNLKYKFVPTSIGTIGIISCSCGEKFCFKDLE